MADIISLDEKQQHLKDKKAALNRKRKILAVRRVFQCTRCAFKCEKCGTQISDDRAADSKDGNDVKSPYRFCSSCADEYIDYIDRLKGAGDPDCYWRNEAWIESWKRWIDYQGATDRYMKSKEFLKLLQELKQTGPHQ